MIAHPFNPPHLIPLIELLGNNETEQLVMERVRTFYESLGKVPVELKKSVPGHIANRIQAVVWQEALHLARRGLPLYQISIRPLPMAQNSLVNIWAKPTILSLQGTGALRDLSNISAPRSKIGGHQQAVLN